MAETTRNMRRRWPLACALVVIGVAIAVVVRLRVRTPETQRPDAATPHWEADSPPADPRLAFATEFRNVRPEVHYVGDAACGQCHDAIARSYQQHPMGRSAEWVRRDSAVDHAAGPHSTFEVSGFRASVVRDDNRLWHHVRLAKYEPGSPTYSVAADLSIGSGSRGRSYVTFDRGAAWQSPLSWFGQRERWDLSPGFDLAKEIRRPVVSRGLDGQSNRPEPIPDSLNRYRDAPGTTQMSIGCERCHGPGELHVSERLRGDQPARDTSIVNPARLAADLKADVCRQCHLQGVVQVVRRGREASEYRPGLPWDQVVSTFLLHADLRDPLKSVGQFEQMEASRCFAGSNGRLSCISCHDPHAKPAAVSRDEYFRSRCNACHDSRGCTLPAESRAEKNDSCIVCHMPHRDSANIAHVAVTDHRLMKRPDAGGARAKVLGPGLTPLVACPPGPHAPAGAERDRDFAIALGNELSRGGASSALGASADARLDRVLGMWPADGATWITRSRVRVSRGDARGGLEAAHTAVGLCPASEVALIQLASAAIAAEDYDSAARAAERLIDINPSSSDHRLTCATAYFWMKDWERAEANCRAVLAIQPLRPNARFMLAVSLHRRGDAAGSRREFDLALALTPSADTRAQLVRWYDELVR